MRNRTYVVDLNKRMYQIARYKQYDTNIPYTIHLVENGVDLDLADCIVLAFFNIKGTIIQKDTIIKESKVTVNLTNDILSVEGEIEVEFGIYKNDTVVTTFTIKMEIEKSINKKEALESSPQWDIILALSALKKETEIVKNDTLQIKNATEIVRIDTEKVKMDTLAVKEATETVKNDTLLVKNDTLQIKNATEVLKGQVETGESVRVTQENARQESISSIENRFEQLVLSKQQDAEVIYARDGEPNLSTRLERDLKSGKTIYETLEGSNITLNNSLSAPISKVEILGNTIQNPENLTDIKSSGILQSDGKYKYTLNICGKNFNNTTNEIGAIDWNTGVNITSSELYRSKDFIRVYPNINIYCNIVGGGIIQYDKNKNFITSNQNVTNIFTNSNTKYIKYVTTNNTNIQLEENTVASEYEPYKENKIDILLPCQLEKVGDLSDRLYFDEKEMAWCVEKKIYSGILEKIDGGNYIMPLNDISDAIAIYHSDSTKNLNYLNGKCNIILEGFQWISHSIKVPPLKVFSNPSNIAVSFPKGTSIENIKQQLIGKKVKYQLATPQKIVLPQSLQIILNSFAGTNHMWLESGEVTGTFKATFAKSLGASINSIQERTNNISNRLKSVEDVKASQNIRYKTETGSILCSQTRNGIVDNVKITGLTKIVNGVLKSVGEDVVNIQILASNNKVDLDKVENVRDLLYKNSDGSLVKPVLMSTPKISDTIEVHKDEKWYFHKRCGIREYQSGDETNTSVITDKTNTVYALSQEEIFECKDLYLDSHDSETLVRILCGVVIPLIEFEITSHVGNFSLVNRERVKKLEERVLTLEKQLLNLLKA